MLGRMQHFVDGFFAQCRRHELGAELIMVEWNPPKDRPPLAEALVWPEDMGPACVRIVTVPPEVHARLDHSAHLPLFQMIGKNVGIRRARGDYVLATNIDILMNDDLMRYMRDSLEPGTMVRVDRFDVPSDVPRDADFGKIIQFCDSNIIRIATRYGILNPKKQTFAATSDNFLLNDIARRYVRKIWPESPQNGDAEGSRPSAVVGQAVKRLPYLVSKLGPPQRVPSRAYWALCQLVDYFRLTVAEYFRFTGGGSSRLAGSKLLRKWGGLHTHACGDFTLLSREDWFRLRAYPEWPMYSWHIDSLFMHLASGSGVREIALDPQYRSYHIEHAAGSGWTPEAEEKLFSRLRERGIAYLSSEELKDWERRCARGKALHVINDENWGFGDLELVESVIRSRAQGAERADLAATGTVR